MKKFITFLSLSAAAVLFTTAANAQSATTTTNTKTAATATDLKSAQTAKEVKTTSATATKTAVTTEAQKQENLNSIKEYERKIEANRNNPKFDLKAAEAELARLKEVTGTK